MSLRILFDATPVSYARPTGAGRYVIGLLEALAKNDPVNRYTVFGIEAELPGPGAVIECQGGV